MSDVNRITALDRYRGCLLAGAAGDALGAAVEFDDLPAIRAGTGPRASKTRRASTGASVRSPTTRR